MKYLVGFSGGTDSVFVAWTLKQQGHEVLLVNIKNTKEKNKCCSLPTELMEIASFLDLPLKIVDATKDFKKYVIEDFVETYLQGNTPNPCINCNENVRFKILEELRKELAFDKVSTGHYVKVMGNVLELDDMGMLENKGIGECQRIKENGREGNYPDNPVQSGNPAKSCNPVFYTFAIPEDSFKDQTYMLYRLLAYQNIVKNLDFPIADYKKEDVKKIIDKNNIPINTSQESQNICFIPDDDYPRFIKQSKLVNIPKGKILDVNGNYMGEHKGLIYYTIGQRKGLDLKTNKKKYVVDLDWENNILIVGDNKDLLKNEVYIADYRGILQEKSENKFFPYNLEQIKQILNIEKVYGRIRYKGQLEEVEQIFPEKVVFKNNVRAITKGQHLVLYGEKNGEIFVIGGGIIK